MKTEKNLAALPRHGLQNVNGSFYFKTMQFMMFCLQYLAAWIRSNNREYRGTVQFSDERRRLRGRLRLKTRYFKQLNQELMLLWSLSYYGSWIDEWGKQTIVLHGRSKFPGVTFMQVCHIVAHNNCESWIPWHVLTTSTKCPSQWSTVPNTDQLSLPLINFPKYWSAVPSNDQESLATIRSP